MFNWMEKTIPPMNFQDHQMLVWHLKINAQILFVHVSEATQPGTNLFQHIPSHFDKINDIRLVIKSTLSVVCCCLDYTFSLYLTNAF